MSNLPDVYKELLASDEGDVVIKLKDGKHLKVISYLIKNRSPVFKSMLDASMKESSTGVVDLSSQYTHEAFREFMAFLYYNKLHTGSYVPLLFEILCIADYFQVDAYRTYITGQIIALIQDAPICLIIASETQKHGLIADAIYTRCLGFLTHALGGCYDVYCGDSRPWCCSRHTKKTEGKYTPAMYTVDGRLACIIVGNRLDAYTSRCCQHSSSRSRLDISQLPDFIVDDVLAVKEGRRGHH